MCVWYFHVICSLGHNIVAAEVDRNLNAYIVKQMYLTKSQIIFDSES